MALHPKMTQFANVDVRGISSIAYVGVRGAKYVNVCCKNQVLDFGG